MTKLVIMYESLNRDFQKNLFKTKSSTSCFNKFKDFKYGVTTFRKYTSHLLWRCVCSKYCRHFMFCSSILL